MLDFFMKFYVGIIVLVFLFPLLLGGGYLLRKLYRRFIPSKKMNQKALLLKQEKEKIFFYNLYFPMVLYPVIYVILWNFGLHSCHFMDHGCGSERANLGLIAYGNVILFFGTGLVEFLLYHFVYWFYTSHGYFCKRIFYAVIRIYIILIFSVLPFILYVYNILENKE